MKPHLDNDYEKKDVGLRGPVLVALALAGVVVGSLLALKWIYHQPLSSIASDDPRLLFTHGPNYDTPIDEDWQAMMQANAHRLDGTEEGTIPLAEAKQQTAENGLPRWSADETFEIQRQGVYLDARR